MRNLRTRSKAKIIEIPITVLAEVQHVSQEIGVQALSQEMGRAQTSHVTRSLVGWGSGQGPLRQGDTRQHTHTHRHTHTHVQYSL